MKSCMDRVLRPSLQSGPSSARSPVPSPALLPLSPFFRLLPIHCGSPITAWLPFFGACEPEGWTKSWAVPPSHQSCPSATHFSSLWFPICSAVIGACRPGGVGTEKWSMNLMATGPAVIWSLYLWSLAFYFIGLLCYLSLIITIGIIIKRHIQLDSLQLPASRLRSRDSFRPLQREL